MEEEEEEAVKKIHGGFPGRGVLREKNSSWEEESRELTNTEAERGEGELVLAIRPILGASLRPPSEAFSLGESSLISLNTVPTANKHGISLTVNPSLSSDT
ncbi:hypothetical protein ACFX1S_041777 [Malus domestica]